MWTTDDFELDEEGDLFDLINRRHENGDFDWDDAFDADPDILFANLTISGDS